MGRQARIDRVVFGTEAAFDRTLTKRIQPAIAAKAGIVSAHLAEKGFTGPEDVFLSDAGLLRIYGGLTGPLPGTKAFSKTSDGWEIEQLCFKKYAACGASHPAMEAALDLAEKHNLKLHDIESLELFGIFVGSGMVDVPWQDAENPHVLAQFCTPYEVACIIKNKKFGPAEITNEHIAQDKEVDQLARKVVIKHQKEWGDNYPGGQTVRIKTKDGRILVASRTTEDILYPESMGFDDIVNKMTNNAVWSTLFTQPQANDLVKAVTTLEDSRNIRDFVQKHLVAKTPK